MQGIQAIAFDFGNTLCPWDEEQYQEVTTAGLRHICSLGSGHCIEEAGKVFARIRDEDSERNLPALRENDLAKMLADTAQEVLGRTLAPSELDGLIGVHTEAFVGVCKVFSGVERMLEHLSTKYRLALLSNYPSSSCIRLSLEHLGVAHFFEAATVVSGDLGVIKPGRRLFQELLSALTLPADQVLFVGDDWVADIVGAHASGLPSVHIESESGTEKQELMDGVFGTFLRRALTMPELSGWENARPLARLNCVVELEEWLERQ